MLKVIAGLVLALAAATASPAIFAQTQTAAQAPKPVLDPTRVCPVPKIVADSEFYVSCATNTTKFRERIRDACLGRKPSSPDSCGALIYTIDPDFDDAFLKEHRLPPTMTAKIGKIAVSEDLNDMVMTVVKSNGSSGRLGPQEINSLLAPIRIANRVLEHEPSGGATRFDESFNLYAQSVRYYPALLVSRKDAPKVMEKRAIRQHFAIPVQIVQDLERLLDDDCLIRYRFC